MITSSIKAIARLFIAFAGVIVTAVAIPCLFFAVLGLMGGLADVSHQENVAFGFQFLGIGAVGGFFVAACIWAFRQLQPREN